MNPSDVVAYLTTTLTNRRYIRSASYILRSAFGGDPEAMDVVLSGHNNHW